MMFVTRIQTFCTVLYIAYMAFKKLANAIILMKSSAPVYSLP